MKSIDKYMDEYKEIEDLEGLSPSKINRKLKIKNQMK